MKKIRLFSLLLLTILYSLAITSYAGDPHISMHSIGFMWYEGDESTISATVKNNYAFSASDYSISYSIEWQKADLSWGIKYEWSKEGITIEPNSETVFESDIPWKPENLGLHRLKIHSYSPDDIDLSNNDIEHNFYTTSFQSIKFKQGNIINPYLADNSNMGKIGLKLPVREEEEGISFLNIIAKNPNLGLEKWIVRNLPISPFDEEHRMDYYYDLSKLEYEEGIDITDFDMALKEDSEPLTVAFDPFSWINVPIVDFVYNVPADNGPKKDTTITSIPKNPTMPVYESFPGYENYYIGCKMPNIGLDSSKNKATDDYAGDWNACGPAAAANSIQWLEDTHPDVPATGSSHRDKMKELSELMERGKEEGVSTAQLTKGKLAYIDKHKLPIHVKYQSWWESGESIPSPDDAYNHSAENKSDSVGKQKPPSWEFLKSEVKKGEDVEILFGWYDKDAKRHGGHWVVVSGFFDSEFMKGLYIKDDVKQSDSTSMREAFIEWKQDDDWGRLVGFDGANNYCWVESVVSESYDPEISFGDGPNVIEKNEDTGISELIVINNPSHMNENILIEYYLKNSTKVSITIYSLSGALVQSKYIGTMGSGDHNYEIPAGSLTKGNYLVVLKAGNHTEAAQIMKY